MLEVGLGPNPLLSDRLIQSTPQNGRAQPNLQLLSPQPTLVSTYVSCHFSEICVRICICIYIYLYLCLYLSLYLYLQLLSNPPTRFGFNICLLTLHSPQISFCKLILHFASRYLNLGFLGFATDTVLTAQLGWVRPGFRSQLDRFKSCKAAFNAVWDVHNPFVRTNLDCSNTIQMTLKSSNSREHLQKGEVLWEEIWPWNQRLTNAAPNN